jgi:hypothetical protein
VLGEVDPGAVIRLELNDCFSGQVTKESDLFTSLDLERNLGSLLNNSIAAATYGDAQAARKLLDEAVKMPGPANEDAQRGFKFADGLIRWRQGDKSAADALPEPTDASDTGARKLTAKLGKTWNSVLSTQYFFHRTSINQPIRPAGFPLPRE